MNPIFLENMLKKISQENENIIEELKRVKTEFNKMAIEFTTLNKKKLDTSAIRKKDRDKV